MHVRSQCSTYHQHLTLPGLSNVAHLDNVWWHLTVASIFTPLCITEGEHIFKKLYFIDYALTVVLNFPPLPPPPSTPTLSGNPPHHCSCSWIMHIGSLATPSPILYCTAPWLFCNYLFVFLNPLISSPIPLHPHPIWQPSKCCVHDSVSVPLVFLVCFLDLIVDRYVFFVILLFIVLIFFFLNKSL